MSCADPMRDGTIAYTPGAPCPDRVVSDQDTLDRWNQSGGWDRIARESADCRTIRADGGWPADWVCHWTPDMYQGGTRCERCGRTRPPVDAAERDTNFEAHRLAMVERQDEVMI